MNYNGGFTMRALLSKKKRGQLGLDVVRNVMLTMMTLAVIGVAIFLALVSLQNANIFTSGSAADNSTDNIINNVTGSVENFFSNTPTIFAILVVVVIILAIAIVIGVVSRFGGGRRDSL